MKFYGREKETEFMQRAAATVKSGASHFVVVTGRRRVGKTRLILESLTSSGLPLIYEFVYQSTGEQRNLDLFAEEISRALALDAVPRFDSFTRAFEFVFKRAAQTPVVLVLDEFQNFRHVNPEVFETLQKLWDLHKNNMQLLLVVSGSVTGAMREIFENGNAPLYARQNALLYLTPFSPSTLKHILADFSPQHTGEDLLSLYALTGGVAQYVETLMTERALTSQAMIEHLFTTSSRTLTEATMALTAEFKGNSALYFDILRLIASGVTSRRELQSHFADDISGHLQKLELHYRLIARAEPVGANGAKRGRIRFELTDELINFWFTFLEPRQQYLEAGQSVQVLRSTLAGFPQYCGRALERFWRRHFADTGFFTSVGPWRDRKGENEIDLVAVDDLEKRIVFAEIKRNPEKINFTTLKSKADAFLELNPKYRSFKAEFSGLSLTELSAAGTLPFS